MLGDTIDMLSIGEADVQTHRPRSSRHAVGMPTEVVACKHSIDTRRRQLAVLLLLLCPVIIDSEA